MSCFRVNENCNGCLVCVQNCPTTALKYIDTNGKREILHNISRCARCGHCWRICPQNAIEFKYLLDGEFESVASFDLVHCQVCGAPIYTTNFSKTISKALENDAVALCPEHKGLESIKLWEKLSFKKAF